MSGNFIYRKANRGDIPSLAELIRKSATSINKAFYSNQEIEAALGNAWAVDEQLIKDNTYWIVENMDGKTVGCGGWSKRRLLFGKSDGLDLEANTLDPREDPARIRAFFVHPNAARQGIGSSLLELSENEARSEGFQSLELVATLSGEKLYTSRGYTPVRQYEVELGNGITNKVVAMVKSL